MIKKSFALFLVSFLVLSVLVASVGLAIDVPDRPASGSGTTADGPFQGLTDFLKKWQKGDANFDQGVAKWLFLILLAALIYAILTSLSFPDNGVIRLIVSVIVGFLATFLITPDEIYGLLAAYSGLGITISLFLPILILVFLTVVISAKAHPIGVFFTRILWLIYGVYILFKGLLIFFVKWGIENHETIKVTFETTSTPAAIDWGTAVVHSWLRPFLELLSHEYFAQALRASVGIGIVMIFIGIAAIYFGVIKTDWIDAWIKKGMRESQLGIYKDRLKKSTEKMKADAEALEEGAE